MANRESNVSARRGAVCALRALALSLGLVSTAALAAPFFFSTGDPDGRIATGSRPGGPGGLEIESADDFILSQSTSITSATFFGLMPSRASVSQVRVEIYRVFPADSQSPPSGNVPTRTNSPSDVELVDRDSASANLNFSTSILAASFTAANSVLDGIFPIPKQNTGGDGSVTGEEVEFSVTFATPFLLGPDHYFFVPQVMLDSGNFFWLSAPKPIVAPGTPFLPDLQSWIRNADLAPDWLRIGTDIVGGNPAPTFNAAFSLTGETLATVPEPGTLALLGWGLVAARVFRRRGQ